MRNCDYLPLTELLFLTDNEEEQMQRCLDSKNQTWDDVLSVLTDESTSDIYVLFKDNTFKRFIR